MAKPITTTLPDNLARFAEAEVAAGRFARVEDVIEAGVETLRKRQELYDAKVKVLSEQIEHHVGEEEQRMEGMFAQARKAGLDMDALGEQLAARKAELIAGYKAGGLEKPKTTTFEEATKLKLKDGTRNEFQAFLPTDWLATNSMFVFH